MIGGTHDEAHDGSHEDNSHSGVSEVSEGALLIYDQGSHMGVIDATASHSEPVLLGSSVNYIGDIGNLYKNFCFS